MTSNASDPAADPSRSSAPADIILAHNMGYLFGWGGGHKCNHGLIRGLAARGHRCRLVAPALVEKVAERDAVRSRLLKLGAEILAEEPGITVAAHAGVELHLSHHASALAKRLGDLTRSLPAAWVLVSEDQLVDHALLEIALESASQRGMSQVVAYLAHSQATLPFGPDSSRPRPARAGLFKRLSGIATVSESVARVVRAETGAQTRTISYPVYGDPPFRRLGDFDRGCVTLINASAIKGLPIFLELARQMPGIDFAAVATWATEDDERAALDTLPNVRLLEPRDDIEDILAETRVLLVPSLWGEAWGLVTVEAMARGIPVLASERGGLPEAKLGVDYVLPVRGIESYVPGPDGMVRPVVPEQDVGPWRQALEELLSDRQRYESLAEASFAAADTFIRGLDWVAFEDFLRGLDPVAQPIPKTVKAGVDLDAMSAEERARLLARLRERARAKR